MPLFTRTGATSDGDFPGKRNWLERIWGWSAILLLANLLRAPFGFLIYSRLRDAEAREKPPEVEPAWHGIAEAELTEEEEHETQRRVAGQWHHDEKR